MQIETKKGSATSAQPNLQNGVIIAHLCNHVGAWGAGFVLAVNDLSFAAKHAYKALCKDHNNDVPLGTTQFVEVKPNVWVANMIAQNGVDKTTNPCLVDYKALNECLKTVFERAVMLKCSVQIPSGMGSGLAGGSEQMIHDIIKTRAICNEINVLEKQMQFAPIVTLWEFEDTTAASYVPGATDTSVAHVVSGVTNTPSVTDIDVDTMLDDLV